MLVAGAADHLIGGEAGAQQCTATHTAPFLHFNIKGKFLACYFFPEIKADFFSSALF